MWLSLEMSWEWMLGIVSKKGYEKRGEILEPSADEANSIPTRNVDVIPIQPNPLDGLNSNPPSPTNGCDRPVSVDARDIK